MFQMDSDKLLCAKWRLLVFGHFSQVGVIQPTVEQRLCFFYNFAEQNFLCLIEGENLSLEKLHHGIITFKGNNNKVRSRASGRL